MPSNLSRLFTYAKASQNDAREARENFTTEALAAAIRDDPEPILTLLREANIELPIAKPSNVETQMYMPEVGTIDLVLVFEAGDVWVEVKVDAGESGDQLNRYMRYIGKYPTTKLVTLAKAPLRSRDLPALTWQGLRRAIGSTVSSPYWRDFRLYLEEIRMADTFDEPISPSEGAALRLAQALVRKVARIVAPAAKTAAGLADLGWRSDEGDVLRDVSSHLRQHGSLATFTHRKLRAGISFGVSPGDADARLGVWLWSNPSATAVRRQLIDVAEAGNLPATWERSRDGWHAFRVFASLGQFADHAAATEWLEDRLRELDGAGLMKLLPTLGLPMQGEEASSDED